MQAYNTGRKPRPVNYRAYIKKGDKRIMEKSVTGAGCVLTGLGVAALAAGMTLLLAWGADSVYSHIFETPDSGAPQITFLYWVIIVFLFNAITSGGVSKA